jgi:hypothetical protein
MDDVDHGGEKERECTSAKLPTKDVTPVLAALLRLVAICLLNLSLSFQGRWPNRLQGDPVDNAIKPFLGC